MNNKFSLQVELLVKYGADVTLTNKDGWNAFHIAARSGKVEVLQYLYSLDSELIGKLFKTSDCYVFMKT